MPREKAAWSKIWDIKDRHWKYRDGVSLDLWPDCQDTNVFQDMDPNSYEV